MNPIVAAAQIAAARQAAAVRAAQPRLAYRTTTGDAPNAHGAHGLRDGRDMMEDEVYCLVCGRATDHFGEHDDLVEAGLAEYRAPYVAWTEAGHAYRIARMDLSRA